MPCGYRILITAFVLQDGTIMQASSADNVACISYDGVYTGTVAVMDGSTFGSLGGAYYEDAALTQSGTLTAVVSVRYADIIFDASGGTVDGESVKTIENQTVIPDLSQLVVNRDGGYVFDGWYYDADGHKPAHGGDALPDGADPVSPVTLCAKWKDPITVSGTVTVSGTYAEDNQLREIQTADRLQSVLVALQKMNADGSTVTVQSKEVTLDYGDDRPGTPGMVQYSFESILLDGDYRIQAYVPGYTDVYQNEASELQDVTDETAYDAAHFLAVPGDDTTAIVNAYLKFVPEKFDLTYEIDGSAIAPAYRPAVAETLIYYADQNYEENWSVIYQMRTEDGTYAGQNTVLTDGAGRNSFSVWRTSPRNVLSSYQVRLYGYQMSSAADKQQYGEDAPFVADHHAQTARYEDAADGQSQKLTITLCPKAYTLQGFLLQKPHVEVLFNQYQRKN